MWSFFERHRELAPFFLRVVVGVHLVHGTVDNVTSWARMHEFADFLSTNGLPLPLAGAVVSAWSQFLCGLAFVLGIWVRPAAAIMIVNFLAALGIAHRGDAYPAIFPALFMLLGSTSLLFSGAGGWSLDDLVARRRARRSMQ